LTVDFNGNVVLTGDPMLPNTVGSTAAFTNQKLGNEGTFRANNLKLRMGTTGLISRALPASIRIRHRPYSSFLHYRRHQQFRQEVHVPRTATFAAGAKTGYVVDYFVNNVGETLSRRYRDYWRQRSNAV
jgi:hypothetical protein